MIRNLQELETHVSGQRKRKRLVLAVAQDRHALEAVEDAASHGFIDPVLVGDLKQIKKITDDLGYKTGTWELIDEPDPVRAVEASVSMMHDDPTAILMKGGCPTSLLLKGVLNPDWGLRKGKLLSHFAWFESPYYHKMLGITDVAINIAPGPEQKSEILQNAVSFLHHLGVTMPRVAVIAAVEVVNEKMPATVDADILTRQNREGLITGCLVDGPLALDNAISKTSAQNKNIDSPVAGDPDLLLMPNIEAGNVLYKSLTYLSEARVASVVLGASRPIVLTSRSDSRDSKRNSILLAASNSQK